MTRNGRHMMEEADVGSGEKSSAEVETQEMIEQIPQRNSDSAKRTQESEKDEQAQRRNTQNTQKP